jgi:hypothetical protein
MTFPLSFLSGEVVVTRPVSNRQLILTKWSSVPGEFELILARPAIFDGDHLTQASRPWSSHVRRSQELRHPPPRQQRRRARANRTRRAKRKACFGYRRVLREGDGRAGNPKLPVRPRTRRWQRLPKVGDAEHWTSSRRLPDRASLRSSCIRRCHYSRVVVTRHLPRRRPHRPFLIEGWSW